MNTDLPRLLDRIAGLRVLVIGDVILDTYVWGATSGLCRESPVPAVTLTSVAHQCGGAANVAVNLRALGAEPVLLSATGDDRAGRRLRGALRARDVDTGGLLVQPGRTTVTKRRVMADGQMLLRLDEGGEHPLPVATDTGSRLLERAAGLLPAVDAVIVSDYGYGVWEPDTVARLAAHRELGPSTLVVDSRRPARFTALRASAVKPNHAEALRLLDAGEPPPGPARADWSAALGDRLLRLTGAERVALTLDADGSLLFERDRPPVRTFARGSRAPVTAAVGAGDAFTAALTLALAAGADSAVAAELASAAAGTAVATPGTSTCDADELRRLLGGTGKVCRTGTLPARLLDPAARDRRVVFTNGCFDLLHGGHVSCLSRAKELGDLLVVGVNSDASVRRLKGPRRPVIPLAERMRVLAALSCVDLVVPFDDDSPAALIEALRPEVYAKGGDYTLATLPEAPLVQRLGGVVHLLPSVADTSTTDIIRRIHALSRTGEGDTP
ncbi:D-glycero-beta-D-manno-heptose 1-phosphate adenylyltransferase [Streptomyces mobaraensis NBRC 13819 = DSM 40847]|uniref:D-glycero-beta-D-manno-heptose 1-phosphate adenylyltransferase n=1 Tax=Streptomyces mobaraensis (strain ATCC 29032 / DSM 40847 / JCM 4168 / NBRC 13819 / NCIMB 11159 / IPCR 16-22) TaxID=1223523 RepID=M3C5I8_STRM1|nr:D-glycero-beta-D-manno-heptose 1-phosphate adenylyltransferase [Streptomyces mobaraensis]EME99230.1 cytidyltransferase [Streptomyces mobaraensis NBRC 13819 = DSM 40847]QTT72085.1 D-glycero-beta-D-manno-heptose 1-phosphate adenylyltransferase [Streptomyces mobaraensis NBRC 13819 = DSM 40847]